MYSIRGARNNFQGKNKIEKYWGHLSQGEVREAIQIEIGEQGNPIVVALALLNNRHHFAMQKNHPNLRPSLSLILPHDRSSSMVEQLMSSA